MLSGPFCVERNKEKERPCINGRNHKKVLTTVYFTEKDLSIGNKGRDITLNSINR